MPPYQKKKIIIKKYIYLIIYEIEYKIHYLFNNNNYIDFAGCSNFYDFCFNHI